MFSFPFLQRPINGSDTSVAPVFKGSIRTLDRKSSCDLEITLTLLGLSDCTDRR